MKIGPSGFCMPVSNRCTALRREAVFKKFPGPEAIQLCRLCLQTSLLFTSFIMIGIRAIFCNQFENS